MRWPPRATSSYRYAYGQRATSPSFSPTRRAPSSRAGRRPPSLGDYATIEAPLTGYLRQLPENAISGTSACWRPLCGEGWSACEARNPTDSIGARRVGGRNDEENDDPMRGTGVIRSHGLGAD